MQHWVLVTWNLNSCPVAGGEADNDSILIIRANGALKKLDLISTFFVNRVNAVTTCSVFEVCAFQTVPSSKDAGSCKTRQAHDVSLYGRLLAPMSWDSHFHHFLGGNSVPFLWRFDRVKYPAAPSIMAGSSRPAAVSCSHWETALLFSLLNHPTSTWLCGAAVYFAIKF